MQNAATNNNMLAIESQVAVPDAAVAVQGGRDSGPVSMTVDNLDDVRLGSAQLITGGTDEVAQARYNKHVADHPDQPATFLTKLPD